MKSVFMTVVLTIAMSMSLQNPGHAAASVPTVHFESEANYSANHDGYC